MFQTTPPARPPHPTGWVSQSQSCLVFCPPCHQIRDRRTLVRQQLPPPSQYPRVGSTSDSWEQCRTLSFNNGNILQWFWTNLKITSTYQQGIIKFWFSNLIHQSTRSCSLMKRQGGCGCCRSIWSRMPTSDFIIFFSCFFCCSNSSLFVSFPYFSIGRVLHSNLSGKDGRGGGVSFYK